MNLPQKFLNQQILTSIGLLSIVAIIIDAYYTSSWMMVVWSFLYSNIVVSLIGSQIILHRYFSHRSFTVNNILHRLFCILSILPGQGSPIAWAAAHRHHHKHSDSELDNHSPKESYFLAMGGWLLKGYEWVVIKKKLKIIPTDLLRDKFVVKIDAYYYYIWYGAICIGALINYKFLLYFLLAPIGWSLFISAFVTLGCHIKLPGSYRKFNTPDNTYNNMYIQLFVLGDALHNNHHHDPSKWNLQIDNNEIDPAAIIIRVVRKQ
jgi:stearoyl-CoA desaturase (delta-9 desaturase)